MSEDDYERFREAYLRISWLAVGTPVFSRAYTTWLEQGKPADVDAFLKRVLPTAWRTRNR